MKKLCLFLITGFLCFNTFGCNNQKEQETELTETETDETEFVEKTSSNDTKTKRYEFKGVTYDIPENWDEEYKDDTEIYYYPANGMLIITVTEDTLDILEYSQDFLEGMKKSADFMEVTQEGTITINSRTAYRIVADMKLELVEAEGEIVTFNTNEGLAVFFMLTYKNLGSSESYKDDLDKILKSISFTAPEQNDDSETEDNSPVTEKESVQETQETEPETKKETPSTTLSQKNALGQAHNYLKVIAFSHSGLVEQLVYEGYSHEDATYAADNCNADWNEQAAKKAKQYLELMSFSRQGLIDQLKYEGFTSEQAEYGVTAAGY